VIEDVSPQNGFAEVSSTRIFKSTFPSFGSRECVLICKSLNAHPWQAFDSFLKIFLQNDFICIYKPDVGVHASITSYFRGSR
jgi:hypothetical protein